MAHMEKYKGQALGAMMRHYDRTREATLERDNIDETRTRLNYTVGQQRGLAYIDERISEVEESQGRHVRADAVRMADWVITAPADLREEDQRLFFETAYEFLEQRYGAENMLGGRVHMDEATPHMHAPLVPVVEREDGKLALSAKDMLSRADLRTFHKDLADAEERALGYRPQVLLSEDRAADKQLSHLNQDEYRAAKDRLERLRRDGDEAEGRNRGLEGERERVARRVGYLEAQVEEREAQVEAREEETRQVEKDVGKLESAVERVRDAVERVRGEIAKVEARIRDVRELIRDRLQERAERREGREDVPRGQEWQEPTIDR